MNVSELDVPPPGVPLNTVTLADPALVRSLARIDAVSCELLTKVVVRFWPFHRTTDAGTNPLPFTVNVNAPLPCKAELGLMLVSAGTGLSP